MFELYKPHLITYWAKQGKTRQKLQLRVWPIKGLPETIVDDRQGYFYASYWRSQSNLTGPKKRRGKVWRIQERHWRRFGDIFSLFRGLSQIVAEAQTEVIPAIHQLGLQAQDLQVKFTDLKEMSPEQIRTLQAAICQIRWWLKGKRRPESTEAQEQLKFCLALRDRTGRINVAVIQTRLGAVNRRLLERLNHVHDWLINYAGWLQTIKSFTAFQFRELNDLKQGINSMLKIVADKKKIQCQRIGLIARIKKPRPWIKALRQIGGFKDWAEYTNHDLAAAATYLKNSQDAAACQMLFKLQQSVLFKQAQFPLSNILLGLHLNRLNGQNNQPELAEKLQGIIREIEALNDSQFSKPVKQLALSGLRHSLRHLQPPPGKSANLKKAEDHLRQALLIF